MKIFSKKTLLKVGVSLAVVETVNSYWHYYKTARNRPKLPFLIRVKNEIELRLKDV